MTRIIFGAIFLLVIACTSVDPNSDYAIVEFGKTVPLPDHPVPNAHYGWEKSDEQNADIYRVRLGDERYHKIILPLVAASRLTSESAIDAACAAALAEVEKYDACKGEPPPTCVRTLQGPRGRPSEIWMTIKCGEREAQ